jgi:hypothetical protein
MISHEFFPVSIRFDPPAPMVGDEFRIIVRMNQPVEEEMTLLFEKQRFKFVSEPGNFPELRPTGGDYFRIDPTRIEIKEGEIEGYSTAAVRKDAIDNDDQSRIRFPDNLVFTYGIINPSYGADAYVAGIVKIRPRPVE